ncbi:MAG: class I SAM-dependent methyltransferase [Caulobacterales bacterium]
MPPQTQREFWNGAPGDRWVQSQEMLDVMLAPMTGPTIDALRLPPAARVLDVGCGSGETTMLLAQRGYEATGVDISEPLINHARRRAADAKSAARFVLGDAGALPHDAQYEALFSRFGVMFFEEPIAAFKNLRALMKPDAQMAFVCWRASAENPWNLLPLQAVTPLLPKAPPPPDPNAPGPTSFADPARTRGILESAGWREIAFAPWDDEIKIGPDLATTADFMTNMGVQRLLAEADVDLDVARRRVEDALAPLARADGVYAKAACWIVTGRA